MTKPASRKRLLAITAALAFVTVSLHSANWSNWRGPNLNGSSDETSLPTKFSTTDGVKWSAPLPGPGASTPIVWGNRVFLTSADPEANSLHAICIDRESGKELWNHNIGSEGYRRDDRSTYASNSPVTDGERVIFFFGSGDLIAYDFAGKKQWALNIQKEHGDFSFQWTFSTSPALYDGVLYMQVLQRDEPVRGRGTRGAPSFLLALDPATGKQLWKHIRPADAKAESLEAFSTPILTEVGGRKELVIAGGDCLTGHDPKTGAELWRWGTWNPRRIGHWRLVPSPVAGGGVILASAPKGEPIYAVKAGLKGSQENDGALAWTSKDNRDLSTDVPTPAFSDGDFFVLNDNKKSFSRANPKDGSTAWTTELPGFQKYRTSPTVADGKIYVMNHAGLVVVLDAKTGEILAENDMGTDDSTQARSSIVVSDGSLFVRTDKALFRIDG